MGKAIDLTGQTFGRLVVLRQSENRTNDNGLIWECQCSCGTKKEVSSTLLRRGKSTSCGCHKVEKMRGNTLAAKHGGKGETPDEYKAWSRLKEYGLCPNEWDDFFDFYCDVGDKPAKGYVLTRRDSSQPHGHKNTYWSNRLDEISNRKGKATKDFGIEFSIDIAALRANSRATQTAAA